MVLLVATCLWLKDKNDFIWNAFITLAKMKYGR
jgi:hypothetical protein